MFEEEKLENLEVEKEETIVEESANSDESGATSVVVDSEMVTSQEETITEKKKVSVWIVFLLAILTLVIISGIIAAVVLSTNPATIDVNEILSTFNIETTISEVEYIEYTSIEDGNETYFRVGLNESNKYELVTNVSEETNIYYDGDLDSYYDGLSSEVVTEESVISLVNETIRSVITNTLWYTCFYNTTYFTNADYEVDEDASLLTFTEGENSVSINNHGLVESVVMSNMTLTASYIFTE